MSYLSDCYNFAIKSKIKIFLNASSTRTFQVQKTFRVKSLYVSSNYLGFEHVIITKRLFTCNLASDVSLPHLLAHKYGKEVLD